MKFQGKNQSSEEKKQLYIPYHHILIFQQSYTSCKNKQGIVCAIICFTAIEALLNDITAFYDYCSKNLLSLYEGDHASNNYLNHNEEVILTKLKQIERKDVFEKINVLYKWNKSEKWYQQLLELKKYRNGLVHLKLDKPLTFHHGKYQDGYPKFLNNLIQKKVISLSDFPRSWIELLDTREFCIWCQETTYCAIKTIINSLPDTQISNFFKQDTIFISN